MEGGAVKRTTEIKIYNTVFEITGEFSATSKENLPQKLKKLILSDASNNTNVAGKFTINSLK